MKSSAYTPQYDNLRIWMKAQRESAGLTLRDVARAMGRHHSVVGKMEQDRRKIELMEFISYCNAVSADPHAGLDVAMHDETRAR